MDGEVFVYRLPPSPRLAESSVEFFVSFHGYPFSAILVVHYELLKSSGEDLGEMLPEIYLLLLQRTDVSASAVEKGVSSGSLVLSGQSSQDSLPVQLVSLAVLYRHFHPEGLLRVIPEVLQVRGRFLSLLF